MILPAPPPLCVREQVYIPVAICVLCFAFYAATVAFSSSGLEDNASKRLNFGDGQGNVVHYHYNLSFYFDQVNVELHVAYTMQDSGLDAYQWSRSTLFLKCEPVFDLNKNISRP